MKKVIIVAAVAVGVLATLRRFGPALGERAMKKCEQMFDHMSEDSPPKRMIRGIDQLREQNVQILRYVRELRERPASVAVD